MTDKTDIAAQLSKRILHYADMASCTSEGTSVLGADLLKLIGDTINDLIGKLEAERQRAAGSEEELHKALHREKAAERKLLAAQEEIAKLKGDQVPVALVDERQGSGGFCLTQHGRMQNLQHGAELFTTPQKPVVLPDINEDLVEILGRPNFTCSRISELFRRNGADIKRKSENEQAFVIHWLIGVYLTHGSEWRLVAEAELKAIADKIKAAGRIVARDADKVDITCWSCRRFVTFQQHADTDGFCPHCNAEIELDDKVGQ